jgi:hypothetical protein
MEFWRGKGLLLHLPNGLIFARPLTPGTNKSGRFLRVKEDEQPKSGAKYTINLNFITYFY